MRVIPVLLALALLSIPAAAAAPDSSPAETQPMGPAAEGSCAAPFDLGAELDLREVAASPAAEDGDPGWLRPAKRLGYCHCGCGARCETSADCGGSPCRPFITCC